MIKKIMLLLLVLFVASSVVMGAEKQQVGFDSSPADASPDMKFCAVCQRKNFANATECTGCRVAIMVVPLYSRQLPAGGHAGATRSVVGVPPAPGTDEVISPVSASSSIGDSPKPLVIQGEKYCQIRADKTVQLSDLAAGGTAAAAAATLTGFLVNATITNLAKKRALMLLEGKDTAAIDARLKKLRSSRFFKIGGAAVGAGLLAGGATALARRRRRK